MWIWYAIVGVFGGLLGGMGMGGGTLLIPALTVLLSVPQHTAQAVNLIAFVPMSAVALIVHCKKGLIDKKCAVKPTLSAAVFCVLGALVARSVSPKTLARFFGGFLVILSIFQFFKGEESAPKKGDVVRLTPPGKPLGSYIAKNAQKQRKLPLPESMRRKEDKKARDAIDKRP